MRKKGRADIRISLSLLSFGSFLSRKKRTRVLRVLRVPRVLRDLICNALDIGAERAELGSQVLIAAVHELETCNGTDPVGGECGDDEGGTGSEVTSADACALEGRNAVDVGGVIGDLNFSAHFF